MLKNGERYVKDIKDGEKYMREIGDLEQELSVLGEELHKASSDLADAKDFYREIMASSYPMKGAELSLRECWKRVEEISSKMKDIQNNIKNKKEYIQKNIYAINRMSIATLYPNIICKYCFNKFKIYPDSLLYMTGHECYMCRNCERDEFIHPVKKVIVVLDKDIQGKDNYTHENNTLYLNWFNLKKPFDFDEIHILAADDFDIQEFIMKIKNDIDNRRAKNYKKMCVIIKPETFQNLSENSKRLLKNTFKDLKFGQEQTTGANNM